jgi:phosphatidylglycerophosphate synthase
MIAMAKSARQKRPTTSFDGLFSPLYDKIAAKRRPDGTYPAWVWHLPLALTLSRILLIPVSIGFAIAARAGHGVAASPAILLIMLLIATDALDGGIARRTEHVTRLGARLDPMIDKVAEATIFISMMWAIHHLFPSMYDLLVLLLVIRLASEILIAWFAIRAESRGIEVSAGVAGKKKFCFDCVIMLVMSLALVTGLGWILATAIVLLLPTFWYAALATKYHADLLF